jgi:hypothetical protein
MGRRSVSQASRGPLDRSEGVPVPVIEAELQRMPENMHLRAARPEELCFTGRWPSRAPIVLSPVLLVLGSLPWLAPAPLDALRVLVSLFFAGCALSAIGFSWPRRVRVRVRPEEGQLWINEQRAAFSPSARWVLSHEQPKDAPKPQYRAALVLSARQAWPVLGSSDPAELLRQLEPALRAWPLPVESRWGLPLGVAPWQFEVPAPSRAPARAESATVPGAPVERGLRITMVVMTLAVLLDLAGLLISASAAVPHVHPLSIILPALAGGGLALLTAGLLSAHERLRAGPDLVLEACVFGLHSARARVRTRSVRGVYLIRGSELGHLLVDSAEGPIALPVQNGRGAELRARLIRAIDGVLERSPG